MNERIKNILMATVLAGSTAACNVANSVNPGRTPVPEDYYTRVYGDNLKTANASSRFLKNITDTPIEIPASFTPGSDNSYFIIVNKPTNTATPIPATLTPSSTLIPNPTETPTPISTQTPDYQGTIDNLSTKIVQTITAQAPKPATSTPITPTETPTLKPTLTKTNLPATAIPSATLTPSSTLTATETATLVSKQITRYQAKNIFSFNNENHKLSPIAQNGSADANELLRVKVQLLHDVSNLPQDTTPYANFAELLLSGNGRLDLTRKQITDALGNQNTIRGSLDKNGKLVWNAGGNLDFALANLYDSTKTDQTQVVTFVTHAGHARQVFKAIATSISEATGKNISTLQAQIEANLGYTAKDLEGSEFNIACWRTYNHTKNPVWGNFNFQPAKYKNEIGIGNAHEEDGTEDGKGVMDVDPNETTFGVIEVGPNGNILGDDVTDTSTTLIDYNGQRNINNGNGDNWKPCGPSEKSDVKPIAITTPTKLMIQAGITSMPASPTLPHIPSTVIPPIPTRTYSPGQTAVATSTKDTIGNQPTPFAPSPVPTAKPTEIVPPTIPAPSVPSSTPSF